MIVTRALHRLRHAVRPGAAVLHRVFERSADRFPSNTALVFGEQEITYAELDRKANRMARHLVEAGLRRGSIAALLLPRSVDTYAAMLGILKAGGAYVPLDPADPRERLLYILRNSGAAGMVTTADLAERFQDFDGFAVLVDRDRTVIRVRSSARLGAGPSEVQPGDPCYVMYTSGSTGRPKGVVIEHRSAVALANAEARVFRVGPSDRVYQGAPLCFDLSVEEIWLAFRSGAALVGAAPMLESAGPELPRRLGEAGVTVLSTVPSLLSLLDQEVPGVRLLILGGEPCTQELVRRWSRPGRRLVNTYGPTEATVTSTFADLAPDRPVTIGRPLPGCDVLLLDEHLRAVAPGEPGEICIGGTGVARGYVGLPEETRSRFVADPRRPLGSRRLFRSGDLGRRNAQGELEFLGRLDGQVKVRGCRIELAEIEAVILKSGLAQAAACTVHRDADGRDQLAAYVVTREPLDEDALMAFLRSRVPSYMLPAVIEHIDALPRTPGGKVDRRALKAPRGRASEVDRRTA